MEKSIQKLLDKLGKKGFDTEKKVNAIDILNVKQNFPGKVNSFFFPR